MSLRGASGKPLKMSKPRAHRARPMNIKPLFGTPQRFTTPDKANIIILYDALNLFFTMVYSKNIGSMVTATHVPSGQVYGTFRRVRANVTQFTRTGQRVAIVFAWDNEPREAKAILPQYKMNRDAAQKFEEENVLQGDINGMNDRNRSMREYQMMCGDIVVFQLST